MIVIKKIEREELIIEAGTVVNFSTGDFEDYRILDTYIADKNFDYYEESYNYLKSVESYSEYGFVKYLYDKGLVKKIKNTEAFIDFEGDNIIREERDIIPIKIEVGKVYRTRNMGRLHIASSKEGRFYSSNQLYGYWTKEGFSVEGRFKDIIEEVVEGELIL